MSYWSDRQKKLYLQLEKDETALHKRLTAIYNQEYNKLDHEIAAFYQHYGVDDIIEYRMLLDSLSDADKRLLFEQMDEFAQKYPQYKHLLPVREKIYKLNRLEGLQQSILMHQLKLGAVTQEKVTAYLNKQALRGINAAAEALGFGKTFYFESSEILKQFVGVVWCNGKSFSERIWDNTEKLANYLTTDIAQGFARGDNYRKLTGLLRERFTHVSSRDAYRLIYTEGTYVMAESTIQPFEEHFEKYKISTASDGKVCSVCSALARNVFYIKDRAAGINFPPFHPWCRCTFEIVVDDWDKWLNEYEQKYGHDKAQKALSNFGGNSYFDSELKYNPDAEYRIRLLDKSDCVNSGLSKACKQVAELGYKDNKEHLSLVNLNTGETEYIETGGSNYVGGSGFWNHMLNNSGNRYAFVHNHNNASGFSMQDIETLATKNSVDMFVISRYDGSIDIVERNGKVLEDISYLTIYESDLKSLQSELKNGKITTGEYVLEKKKIIINNLIRDYTKGVIKFV